MKRTKMKVITAIMALVMVISTSQEAFAAAIFSMPAENEIFVQFDGHGQYTEVASTVRTNIAKDPNAQFTAFRFGYSALKNLAIYLGLDEVTAGSGYGAIQVLVTYDAISRVTYWDIENGIGRDPYVTTCKAWLNTNFTQQTHDACPSGGYQTETFLNKEMLSPHYDDPSDWLYYDYYDASGVIEGPIYLTIYNERYILV